MEDAEGDRRFVARAHRPHVIPERLGAIHQARAALLAVGVPCTGPAPTLAGEPWVAVGGRLLEVEAYAGHDAVMDSWKRLEAGMALLAQAVRERTRRGTARIHGWARPPRRPAWPPPPTAWPSWSAMARQPMSSIAGWVARLDEATARRHLAGVGPALQASLRMVAHLDRWQDAFV